MQSDKLDLQIDPMNIMETHVSSINTKIDILTKQLKKVQSPKSTDPQCICKCDQIIDKLSTLPATLIDILKEIKHKADHKLILRQIPEEHTKSNCSY